MPDSAWIAIVLVVVLVVVINLALWFMWRNHGMVDQIHVLRRAGRSLRNPWQKEDHALEELSRRVGELRDREKQEKKE